MTGTPPQGVACALGGAFLWSLTGVLLRYVDAASSWQIIAWRSAVMGVAVALYLIVRYRGGVGRVVMAIGRGGLIGGIVLGLGFTCYISAIQATTIANASILTALVPIAAAVLARATLGERLAARTGLYAAAAVLGVAIMVAEGIVLGGWIGNLFALGAMICQTVFTVALRGGRGVDMVPAIGVGCLVAFVLSSALSGGLAVSIDDFAVIAFAGLVSTLAGNVLFVLAARAMTASVLALLSMIEVVLSPLWAAVFIGELPGRWALVGGMVVIGAVIAQILDSRRAAP